MRGMALTLAALALVLGGCGVTASERLEAYLRAVSGGEPDRGWQYLDETARELGYDNDKAAYIEDAVSADWEAFEWSGLTVGTTDDGFAHAQVTLVSAPDSVPPFLLLNRLLHGICEGEEFRPIGLGAYVDMRVFGTGQLGGGGWTGGQMSCNRSFVGARGLG